MSKILASPPAAKRIAREKKIELINIVASSKDGIVRQKDVIGFQQVFTKKVTPLAFRMAKKNKIDLEEVTGSGHNGKILKADVLKIIGQPDKKLVTDEVGQPSVTVEQVEASKPTSNKLETQVAPKPQVAPIPQLQEDGNTRRVAMSPMRKVIAKRMSESYFDVPAVHIDNEVDMTKLLDLRQSIIPTIQEETGYRVSVGGDLISMATIKSLKKHPSVNASIDVEKQEIIYHDYVNLAIAVGLENGLLTPPVVNSANTLSLKQYVSVAKPLFEAASTGKISSEQLQGSTFTISNLGMFDTDSFTPPIINLPNAAILGVNATKKKKLLW